MEAYSLQISIGEKKNYVWVLALSSKTKLLLSFGVKTQNGRHPKNTCMLGTTPCFILYAYENIS